MAEPSRPLRFRLFLLAASGLLPLALVAAVAIAYVVHDRRQETQRSALELSRALGTAVDAELRSTIGVLQSLGEADDLAGGRLEPFQGLARRVAERQGWRSVVLADAQGRVLMSSSVRLAEVSPVPVDPESMRKAIETREPVIGRVATGRFERGPAFAVRLPILRDGRVVHVLSAVIPAERLFSVISRQNVPSTWVVGLFDQHGTRVVRSVQNPVARPSPSLQALLDQGRSEGMGPTYTLEGMRSYTGYSRLRDSGWVVAVGISASEADQALIGPLAAVGAGLVGSLLLSAFLAWYFTRRVSEPIEQLKGAAAALGRGEPVRIGPLGVGELDEVGAALAQASQERERAAAEREALLARATEALQRAEEAGRSKDEFLAMLGHELRNPLAPITTALTLMDRKGDDATRAEREIVQRQLAHMTRLVDDLLDISRITGKRLAMRTKPVQIAEVIAQAAAAIRPILGERRLDLVLEPDAADAWVLADDDRLAQVMTNLLNNGVKFTAPAGHITVTLRAVGHEAVEIDVLDDGVGMPPDVCAHVFDLFYQAPQGHDRARGGLGLGLAIARSLVEMHGGTLRAESPGPGQGSRFTLSLPRTAAPAAPAPAPAAGPVAAVGKILVVDDNQDAADTAATLLEMTGYQVRTAYEPQSAIAAFEDFRPDVALLDIGLPGMSGYELARRLRQSPHGGRSRLVALTGYGTAADVARSREAGFDRHLSKPAAPDKLLETVQALCEAGQAS